MENYVELKQRIKELRLRGTDFLDRLLIDYKSRSYKKVLSVDYEPITETRNIHCIRCKGSNSMPFKYLPNCSNYQGVNNSYSWIDALFGIRKRSASQGGTIISWRNKARNSFMRYRFLLMGYYRDEGYSIRYWLQALNMMRTDVFLVASFNHVAHGWEKTMKPRKVRRLLQEVRKMIQHLPIALDYKRVYIPKDPRNPKGPLRPLGVPTVAWRIYLHMWNVLVNWWVVVSLDPNQHAYQPGKGTWTAWRALYERIQIEPQVYEFDLKNFFGGVDLSYNEKEMVRLGIPEEIAEYLRQINQSIVKLSKEDKMDESHVRSVILNTDGSLNPNLSKDVKLALEGGKELVELLKEGFTKVVRLGVPQGAATSCTLSLLNLRELFSRLRGLIMYADDGLYFPLGELEDISVPDAGVQQAYEKSSWVKRDGTWVRSLKFLGLEYIPAGISPREMEGEIKWYPRLRAFTKLGARLEFDELHQFRIFLKANYRMEFDKWAAHWYLCEQGIDSIPPESTREIENVEEWIDRNWEEFCQLSIEDRLGLLFRVPEGTGAMANLYADSWKELIDESEEFRYDEWSWCSRRWGRYLKTSLESGDLDSITVSLRKWSETDPVRKESIASDIEEMLSLPNDIVLESRDILFENVEIEERYLPCIKLWKRLIKIMQLSEGNSSSYAVDDLLVNIRNLDSWDFNSGIRYRFHRHPKANFKSRKRKIPL